MKPIYEDTKKTLDEAITTIYVALNSTEIKMEESRIPSNLVTTLQGARGLFLEAIKEGE